MSLESLSALKQLAQVRQQGEQIQEQNLQQVNNQVQQTGTSEAQRVDQLNLETAKAEYEVALHQAKVETLQKKLERDHMATELVKWTMIVNFGISTLDFAWNTAKDLSGDRNLNDQSQRQRTEALDPNSSRTVTVRNNGTDATDNYTFGSNDDFSTTVYLTSKGGDDSVSGDVRAATITKDDIRNTLKDYLRDNNGFDQNGNLTEQGRSVLDSMGISSQNINLNNFDQLDVGVQDMLMSTNSSVRAAFQDLFHDKSHTILKSEVGNYLDVLGNSRPSEINMDSVRGNLEARGLYDGSWNRIGDDLSNFRLFKAASGFVNTKEFKATWNNLVTLAETNIPFLQAFMAQQERERQTAEELQAALEKLAAAKRKVDDLRQLMVNIGGDGLGN